MSTLIAVLINQLTRGRYRLVEIELMHVRVNIQKWIPCDLNFLEQSCYVYIIKKHFRFALGQNIYLFTHLQIV